MKQETKAPRRRGRIWRVVRSAVGTYLLLCVIIFIIQRKIQYYPDASDVAIPRMFAERGLEDVSLHTEDGLEIKAWYWPRESAAATLVVFHGNAGHRGHRQYWMETLRDLGYGVFLLDYRGYGGSEGSPTEDGLYADGDAAIRWLHSRGAGPLIYIGESLGSGVAVEMAVRHPPTGLVIQSGFSSAVAVGLSKYPFLPVSWMLWDRFENDRKVSGLECPFLQMHGDGDGIIALEIGKDLFARANEPKTWKTIQGVGHNDVLTRGASEYYFALEKFLKDCLVARAAKGAIHGR